MAHSETHTWHQYTLTIAIVDGEMTDVAVEGPDCWGTWNSVANEETLYRNRDDEMKPAPKGLIKFVEKMVWDFEERNVAHYKHN